MVVWGWLAVGLLNLCIAASMAELLSAYPTAGGLYYWSWALAPQRSVVVARCPESCSTHGLHSATRWALTAQNMPLLFYAGYEVCCVGLLVSLTWQVEPLLHAWLKQHQTLPAACSMLVMTCAQTVKQQRMYSVTLCQVLKRPCSGFCFCTVLSRGWNQHWACICIVWLQARLPSLLPRTSS